MIDVDRAKQIHAKLVIAAALLKECREIATNRPPAEQFRPDTYMALGQADGHIDKAKAFIAREIDDAT